MAATHEVALPPLPGLPHVLPFAHRLFALARGILFLRPSLDRTFRAGDLLTMSDSHDIVPGKVYPTPANEWSMIHLDPTPRAGNDGLIPAPVISFEQALARFGRA